MAKITKKAKALSAAVDSVKLHGVDEAIALIKKHATAKFDETVEVAMNLKSGSKEPGKISAGTIKRSQLSEIAEAKMADLNANDIEAATKIIEGSARAMGLQVVEG